MKKPVIGITPLIDYEKESYWMLPGYMSGIENAGGIPLMLPLTEDPEDIRQLLDLCDGILIAGGQDVCPVIYGEEELPCCKETAPERDRMELVLLDEALSRDMPVFGICRGLQFINAALGGTLWQDLPSQRPSDTVHVMQKPYDAAQHKVRILPGTKLFDLLAGDDNTAESEASKGNAAGAEQAETADDNTAVIKPTGSEIPAEPGASANDLSSRNDLIIGVNSLHHQAVRELSPRLEAMAFSEDGLVEAIRMPEKRFVWAVQWHPEFSWRVNADSRKLFLVFITAAQK